ncbi:MAG: tyrosine--tRNA ligase [Patescibacteria group bacterium]|nr:tyrosine--tRNA ligase [Patescibacteria group bacterium]
MSKQNHQINQLLNRGVSQILPDKKGLAKLLAERKITLYLGIDPTAGFLHLGHGVVLNKLQQFAELGHHVILLVGNGTVRIGDPTGRDDSRPMLTDEKIEKNFKNWKKQASKILDFDLIEIRRNGDWLDKLNYADLVKLMAKTTVQQLLERDMFQRRIENEQPIFSHELIYPLLQGYDSVVMDVDLELGGTDQTFNMMMGRTLQKAYNNKEKWVLTTPLIEGTDSRKMSKSYHNYVALTAPAKKMYGKLMSIQDNLITKYFEVLTKVSMEEIEQMEQEMKNGANPMDFKKKLALTITSQLHDADEAKKAEQYFEKTIQLGELPNELPEIQLKQKKAQLLEVLSACQPKQSNNQLRRLALQGAVRLMPENKKLTDAYEELKFEDEQVIKIGKLNYYRLKIS